MQLKVYSDVVQGTDEWHELRRGKFTGSNAQAIASAGKGLDTYTTQIACSIFTGKGKKGFKSDAMQKGNDLEYITRSAYEFATGNTVYEVGFGKLGEWVGSSPDGLIGDDGGVELKTREQDDTSFSEKHGKLLLGEEDFESGYIWQCHFNMYVFGRKWWDLVSYDPSFKDKAIHIHRVERDEDKIEKIVGGLSIGIGLVKKKLQKLEYGK